VLEFTSSRERANSALKRLWKPLVFLSVILGFSTLLPINVGRPNFFGSFTLCSFAPVATLGMFILALTVYAFINKRKRLLYGNVALLLLIVGFTGFWVYDAKIPIDSIEMNITNVSFWIGEDPHWIEGPANTSSIFFNVTLHNPTDRDIPAFHSENHAMQINDKSIGLVDILDIDIQLQTPLKAHSMITWPEMWVVFEQKYADPDVWAALLSKNFTFTITGVLVMRYYWGGTPSSVPEYERRQYSGIWASKPYSLSYTFEG